MKKIFIYFIAVIIAVILLMQCTIKKPIIIGAILTLTGSVGDIGIEIKNSLQIAEDEINASGGLNGKKIQFIFEDSKSEKEEGIKTYYKIEQKHHPVFYITDMSYVAAGLAPILENNNTPLIAFAAVSSDITENKKWVFKYSLTAKEEVQPIGLLINKMKIKSLGVLYSEDESGKSIVDELTDLLKSRQSGVFVKNISYPLTNRDFSKQINFLKNMEAIYFTNTTDGAKYILEQFDKTDYNGILLSTNLLSMPQMRKIKGADGIYISATSFYNINNTIANMFKDKYIKLYSIPVSHYGASAYDMMNLISSMFENKEISKVSLRSSLEGEFVYPGILGTLRSQNGNHDLSFPLYPAQIINGELKYLENR